MSNNSPDGAPAKDPNEIGKEPPADYFSIDSKTKEEKTNEDPAKEEQKADDAKKEPSPCPLPPVPGTEGVEALPYYHGLVPREDMKELLTGRGTYLIRTTELNSGEARTYCLSVIWDDEIRHFPIKPMPETGLFSLGGSRPFPTIIEMLSYFTTSGDKFSPHEIRLNKPVERQSWELLHANVRLSTELGKGAFGEVYSGTLETLEGKTIKVAVKVMKSGVLNKEKIEETMAEARRLRHLDHPNIVKCYGVAADIEPIYIIMELVKGGSLDKHLQKNGDTLDVPQRVAMLRDVSSAISYLHDENLIHCDIASRNCLYASGTTKVSDFGMSRKADCGAIATGERMPIRWIAPEAFSSQCFTKQTDIWAVGILFWEIFSNAAEPYTGWTSQQIRDQVTNHKYHLTLPEWAPGELKELLEIMFSFEPEKRISAKKILKEVEKLHKQHSKERVKMTTKDEGAAGVSTRKKNSSKKAGGTSKKEKRKNVRTPRLGEPRTSMESVDEKRSAEKTQDENVTTAAMVVVEKEKKGTPEAVVHEKKTSLRKRNKDHSVDKEKKTSKDKTIDKAVDEKKISLRKRDKDHSVDKEKKTSKDKTVDEGKQPKDTPPPSDKKKPKKKSTKKSDRRVKNLRTAHTIEDEGENGKKTSTKKTKKKSGGKDKTKDATKEEEDNGGENKATVVDEGKKTVEDSPKKEKKTK